ncbi:MAG: helix-turn-helix domain-containing protein [Candidatus Sulfotelmatobacter sp.]
MEAFGDKLRKQREQRGITLEAISSTTKISTRMLRALEEEKFEQLPGGVFNKGFVRAYARQVGLDEEEAIADYLAALRESQIQAQPILPDFRTGKAPAVPPKPLHHPAHEALQDESHAHARPGVIATDDNPSAADRRLGSERRNEDRRNEDRRVEERRTGNENQNREPWQIENRPAADLLRSVHGEQNHDSSHQSPIFTTGSFGQSDSGKSYLPWATLAAALLIVTAALAFWNVHRRNRSLHQEASASASSVIASSQAPTHFESSASKSSSATHSLKAKLESPAAVKEEKISSAAARPLGAQNANASAPASRAAISQPIASNAAGGSASIPAAPPSKAVSQSTAGTTANPFTLLIRAEKNSWVSITADGKLVAEETLIAPAEKSVRANNDIVVKAGNAAGVSFLLNSKEIPAQGQDGQVRTYIFDSSGVKVSPSARPPSTD